MARLATNLLRHAPCGGSLLLRRLGGSAGDVVGWNEFATIAKPGIFDLAEALRGGETALMAGHAGHNVLRVEHKGV